MDMDPAEDKADHTLAILAATTYPICQLSLESESEYDGEVYMVGQGDQLPEKTVEEIQRKAEEEIAHVEHLARVLDERKGHNSLTDDSEGSKDDHRDGAPARRHHPKFNS
jgi:hypothetical protein